MKLFIGAIALLVSGTALAQTDELTADRLQALHEKATACSQTEAIKMANATSENGETITKVALGRCNEEWGSIFQAFEAKGLKSGLSKEQADNIALEWTNKMKAISEASILDAVMTARTK